MKLKNNTDKKQKKQEESKEALSEDDFNDLENIRKIQNKVLKKIIVQINSNKKIIKEQ